MKKPEYSASSRKHGVQLKGVNMGATVEGAGLLLWLRLLPEENAALI